MRRLFSWCVAAWLSLANFQFLHAENWPAWRGPLGTGVSQEKDVPERWSKNSNVAWKAKLPGPGNSTPIVWNDKVFVTSAADGGKRRMLLCFNRENGEQLWVREVTYDKAEKTHETNPYCSASAATDGKLVVVWHGSAGLFCYDFDGKELWRKDLGEFDHIWGNASSPVIYDHKVILNAGPGIQTFLAAYEAATGKELWRREITEATSEKFDEFRGSWSTPVAFEQQGRTLFALSMPEKLIAFDPNNGETIWECRGVSKLHYTSPLVGDGLIVAMSGYHGPAMAVKIGGQGDVTDTHRLWLHDQKIPQRVGSGIIIDAHIYILNENGVAWCLNAQSGERLWEKRIGAPSWSSMCFADGRLYVSTMYGSTIVIEPDPSTPKVLAENRLEEVTRGSHAFSNGQVFIRTYEHLWCLGEKP